MRASKRLWSDSVTPESSSKVFWANERVAVIGVGNMGMALVNGLTNANPGAARKIIVSGRDRAKVKESMRGLGVAIAGSNSEAASKASLIVLAVKPQIQAAVIAEIRDRIRRGSTVLSIAAGIPTSMIEEQLGGRAGVVRAMPNIAASVGASATAICPGKHSKSADMQRARMLMGSVGTVAEVSEDLMDAITGLSGTGPLYVFTILEGLSDAGVKMGLSREVSTALAIQTLVGSAQLVRATGEHPAKLRELVTSPGGTAITALHFLEKSGLKATLMDAVEAATLRSAQLGSRWKRDVK